MPTAESEPLRDMVNAPKDPIETINAPKGAFRTRPPSRPEGVPDVHR